MPSVHYNQDGGGDIELESLQSYAQFPVNEYRKNMDEVGSVCSQQSFAIINNYELRRLDS